MHKVVPMVAQPKTVVCQTDLCSVAETDQAVGMYQHTSSNLQYTALSFATATFMNSFGPLMDPLARHVPVDAAHFANNFGPEANPAVHHGSVPSVSNITIFEQASNTPMNHAPTKQTKRKRAKQDQKLGKLRP